MKKVSELDITCNRAQLEAKSHVNYLGTVLDQDMSGKTMGTSIIKILTLD